MLRFIYFKILSFFGYAEMFQIIDGKSSTKIVNLKKEFKKLDKKNGF